MKRVLYFSLDEHACTGFSAYVENKSKLAFFYSIVVIKKEQLYKDVSDLHTVLDSLEDLGNLCVIVDYTSLCVQSSTFDSFSRAQDYIQRAILKYPEVLFLFDESHGNDSFDYSDFLFLGATSNLTTKIDKLYKEYHQFNILPKINNNANDSDEESVPFSCFADEWDNLFDGSNLRYLVKLFRYEKLNVTRHNFSLSQESRRDHLALCVEEEHSQNRFDSYVLFANGFRVLPVKTSNELYRLNRRFFGKEGPSLIVRDYDLQFSDLKGKTEEIIGNKSYEINNIDLVRGGKYWDEKKEDICPKGYEKHWYIPKNNKYWNNLYEKPTFFITKGNSDGVILCPTEKERLEMIDQDDDYKKSPTTTFTNKVKTQYLRGISKPVSGIYLPVHNFDLIRERFEDIQITTEKDFIKRDKEKNSDDKKRQVWEIKTGRKNHDHGVSLDIYDTVQNILRRAKLYYGAEKYIRAAVLSTEAMELLNGYHEALMLQAYYIHAISENAIAMNAIGGSENELSRDAAFRVRKIEYEIDRMMYHEGKSRSEFKDNILNQIFSDCKSFCHKYEHFEAEGCYISAMGYLNDGVAVTKITSVIKKRYQEAYTVTVIHLSERLFNLLADNSKTNRLALLRLKRRYLKLTGKEWEPTTITSKKKTRLSDIDNDWKWFISDDTIASMEKNGIIKPAKDGHAIAYAIENNNIHFFPIQIVISRNKQAKIIS